MIPHSLTISQALGSLKAFRAGPKSPAPPAPSKKWQQVPPCHVSTCREPLRAPRVGAHPSRLRGGRHRGKPPWKPARRPTSRCPETTTQDWTTPAPTKRKRPMSHWSLPPFRLDPGLPERLRSTSLHPRHQHVSDDAWMVRHGVLMLRGPDHPIRVACLDGRWRRLGLPRPHEPSRHVRPRGPREQPTGRRPPGERGRLPHHSRKWYRRTTTGFGHDCPIRRPDGSPRR